MKRCQPLVLLLGLVACSGKTAQSVPSPDGAETQSPADGSAPEAGSTPDAIGAAPDVAALAPDLATGAEVAAAPPDAAAPGPGDIPHRPMSVACPISVGPSHRDATGKPIDGCTADDDCNKNGALGIPYGKGHCITFQGAKQCSYDDCLADGDCPSGNVCACQGQVRGYAGVSPGNACIAGNCRTDADCVEQQLCSPSVSFETGPFYGIRGYYCHTPKDLCHKDGDCPANQSCAFDPQAGAWACSSRRIAG